MRRSGKFATTMAGALVAALALSACGSSADAEENSSETAASSFLPAAEGTTEYPLTLTTAYGETELGERPQRIAVVGGLGDLEAAVALGISPVLANGPDDTQWLLGNAEYEGIDTWIDIWGDSLESEAILASDPDLILAVTYTNLETDYDRLSTIAPVLALEEDTPYDWDWKEVTRAIGEATDLSAAAEEAITEAEDHVTEAAAAHPEYAGHTVSVIANRGPDAGIEFVNSAGSQAESLLSELGFAAHPNAEAAAFEDNFSLENLSLVEADVLVVARHGGGDVEAANAWLEPSELYQSLDVVKRGDVRYIDWNPDTEAIDILRAFSYPNVLSVPWTVDELNSTVEGTFTS